MKPMKIAIIHAADSGGGAEACVVSLHRSLKNAGHDSRLHVGYRYLDDPGIYEIPRVRCLPGLIRLVRFSERAAGLQNLYAPGLRRVIQSLKPDHDLVHFHTLWGGGNYADLACIRLAAERFPTILTLHDEWMLTGHCACSLGCERWKTGCGRCPDLSIPPSVQRDATRLNFIRKRNVIQQSAIHVTAVSNATRAQIKQSPIFRGKPISVIYNGIDVKKFCPGDRRQARRELGLPEDGVMVLLAGQTIEGINQGIAQQAAAALNRMQNPQITALLVGRSAPKVATTLSVPFRVLPFQDTAEGMARCYRAADLTLVSSEVETFGRIAAESQACGTPVITSDAGGLPEVVGHDVGGLVVPNRSVEGFEAALSQLLPNRVHRTRLAQGGLAWVRERFADDHITQNYLDLYQQLRRKRRNQ